MNDLSKMVEFIQAVFVLKGWKWRDASRPPSRRDIRKHILSLIDELDRDQASCEVTSGRILVRRTDADDTFTDYAISIEVGEL